ncbi:MAG: AAA family ATPase [Oscillospiraceae bacterium]|nr:AAA family ATPase [Oscillospiraceae bacterium]
MRIYSMTATFGKLEHEPLTLNPGLNIIEAPNEWGKSTWCAFLVAMLYGLDTRAKSTKTVLADKERYLPWSGSPMAGRMDLNWNGRDITIERRTKGRSILGEFKAYETESGLDVPELTAANCGQMLLGVEKNVFTRAGFLKFTDLPVTQDESLRRRLNALVTTGDESGAGDALAQKLKDLKNRCRHNKTGLLPQAEAEQAALEAKYTQLQSLKQQSAKLHQRQAEVEERLAQLENHRTSLQYAAAQEDANRVAEAIRLRDSAVKRAETARAACEALPSRQDAEQAVASIREVHQQWQSLQMESEMLPREPEKPEAPASFQGMSPDAAIAQVAADTARYETLNAQQKKENPLFWILAGLMMIAGLAMLAISLPIGIGFLASGIILIVAAVMLHGARQRHRKQTDLDLQALCRRYGSNHPEEWLQAAQIYEQKMSAYLHDMAHYQEARGDLDQRARVLKEKITHLSGNTSLQERLVNWMHIIDSWDKWADAQRDLQRAESHAETAQAMAKNAQPPSFPDQLRYSEEETARLLSDASLEHRQLQLRMGQSQGLMEALGDEVQLERQLEAVRQRIAKLEETYAALELAQNALTEATAELQRRFAPKIAARAQTLFNRLTGNRYDRLILGDDLSLSAAAEGEDTIRASMWRSDGTVDQLYLALRLAVAEELTPDAPLVLDDALVRFDDARLATAMEILREEANDKQVILFTCQSREGNV